MQAGDRFDSRSTGSRDVHPSGLPRPGRGRGRGRGRGNNFGSEDCDSDYGSAKWGSNENDGLSTFPGAKVQNSPGRDPWGWGSAGSGGGQGGISTGGGNGGGDWGSGYATDRGGDKWGGGGIKGAWSEGGSGGSSWGTGGNIGGGNGSSPAPGWGGNSSGGGDGGGGGWGGGTSFGGRPGGVLSEELANPNKSGGGLAAGFGASSTGWSDSRRSIPSQPDTGNGWSGGW